MAKLHFYYSAMNAGKSTTLLQSSYNYCERGMDTLIFAPKIDNRFGNNKVASRIGLEADAVTFDDQVNLFDYASSAKTNNPNLACILIDEAQFLSKQQVFELCQITDLLNMPVLAYGLRSDFLGEPFPASLYLLTWADILIELKTICHCGKKAAMNLRIDTNGKPVKVGAQVEVGGNDRYLSLCRKHFFEALEKYTNNGDNHVDREKILKKITRQT